MKIVFGKSLPHSPVGLSAGADSTDLMAWDAHGGITLHDEAGNVLAKRLVNGVISAALSADGKRAVAVTRNGLIHILDKKLAQCLEIHAKAQASSVAIDKHGRQIAVGFTDGTIGFWDGHGKEGSRFQAPSPAASMAFGIRHPWLAFAAGTGMAGCTDTNGAMRWREGLPHQLGPIAMAGESGTWYLPCHDGGLVSYGPLGAPHRIVPRAPACRLAACNHMGTIVAVGSDRGRLSLLRSQDEEPLTLDLPVRINCLAMDSAGTMIMAGLNDRRILWIRL